MRRRLRLLALVALSGAGLTLLLAPVAAAQSARHTVIIQIHLDQTRVHAGTTIRGTAVLTNTTSKPVLVVTCAINGWLEVGVRNAHIPFTPAFSVVGCAPTIQLRAGPNRFPIRVLTTYLSCSPPRPGVAPHQPVCRSGGPPPLPAGGYHTKVVVLGLPTDTLMPRPTSVTLLPARSYAGAT